MSKEMREKCIRLQHSDFDIRQSDFILLQGHRGTHQSRYPSSRTSISNAISKIVSAIQTQTYPFESALRLSRLESQPATENALTVIQENAKTGLDQFFLHALLDKDLQDM